MLKYLLAKNGESDFHIVNSKNCDETVRFAASEMQKYILMATNTVIPYFSDVPICPKRGPEIRIGADVRGETFWESDIHDEGFVIRGDGENITITGKTSRGVLYGVYGFLEIFLNYRCFTKDVEYIDKKDTLEIELSEIRVEPSFDFRDAYFRNAFDGAFASKNRLNSSLADISRARGGRVKWYNFHHSFNDLVPDYIYFKEHPEYFSEVDGVRVSSGQLCLTNPEVLDIAEKTLRKWISENPECKVFSVAQNDTYRYCTCEKCKALYEREGSQAGPIIHFVNELADRIREDYPDVMIHTFAYQYSVKAPRYVVARDNVIVRFCTITSRFDKTFEDLSVLNPDGEEAMLLRELCAWRSHAKNIYVWDYIVSFWNYLMPFVTLHNLKDNLLYFKKNGVLGVLEQGNFAFGGGGCFDDLKSYIISRLLWNCETDIDDEIHRFCRTVYGCKAGEYMEEYTCLAEKASTSAPLVIFQFPDAEYITDEYVKRADELVSRAMSVAEDEEKRRRIQREYLSVRFLKLARSDMDFPKRDELIDEFFNDVKRHGITEIRERTSLPVTRDIMKNHRYLKTHEGEYRLYYIMK